jgi:hypothetical protein
MVYTLEATYYPFDFHLPSSVTINSSETPVSFYKTTRYNIQEDSHLHTCEISGSHNGEYRIRAFWDIAPCSLVGLLK